MKNTTSNSTLKVKKVDSKVAPGFEALEQKVAPAAVWSSR
jgi:hypothetical protein